jgi:hypothetical protein
MQFPIACVAWNIDGVGFCDRLLFPASQRGFSLRGPLHDQHLAFGIRIRAQDVFFLGLLRPIFFNYTVSHFTGLPLAIDVPREVRFVEFDTMTASHLPLLNPDGLTQLSALKKTNRSRAFLYIGTNLLANLDVSLYCLKRPIHIRIRRSSHSFHGTVRQSVRLPFGYLNELAPTI